MSVNYRIKQVRDKFCNGDNAEFAKILGTSKQYASNISNEGKSVGGKILDKLLNLFPEVNPIWLKMGEGEMLKTGNINVKGDGNISNTGVIDGNITNDPQNLLEEIRKLKDEVEQLKKDKAILHDYINDLKNKK